MRDAGHMLAARAGDGSDGKIEEGAPRPVCVCVEFGLQDSNKVRRQGGALQPERCRFERAPVRAGSAGFG